MKWFIALILMFWIFSGLTHEWSEPICISNSSEPNTNSNFCVDDNGNIHCVWLTHISTFVYNVMYSISSDDGQTWSPPILISEDSIWNTTPLIVSDFMGNIHVRWVFNVAGFL
jgi:hypothetical protein